jgi:hypothetical protein
MDWEFGTETEAREAEAKVKGSSVFSKLSTVSVDFCPEEDYDAE